VLKKGPHDHSPEAHQLQGVPLRMGFIVKNPSKRSVSLKNGLEEKKGEIQ
jgi:hypothetical protein